MAIVKSYFGKKYSPLSKHLPAKSKRTNVDGIVE